MAINYNPVSFLVNDRYVNHIKKCGLFLDYQYVVRSSRLTADFLTVVSDRIARVFDISLNLF